MNICEKIKPVEYCKEFTDDNNISYVLATQYGSNGRTPTSSFLKGACLSSSGDSACGGYLGDEKIDGTNLYIVSCSNGLECHKQYCQVKEIRCYHEEHLLENRKLKDELKGYIKEYGVKQKHIASKIRVPESCLSKFLNDENYCLVSSDLWKLDSFLKKHY